MYKHVCIYIYTYIYIYYIYNMCIYIYIYTYKERGHVTPFFLSDDWRSTHLR